MLYLIIWYMALNEVATFDYLGVVLAAAGRPAGPHAVVVGAAGLGMAAAALAIRRVQHLRR